MDKRQYRYDWRLGVVMPRNCGTYVLFIDKSRRFAKAKDMILKRLLTICEWLAS